MPQRERVQREREERMGRSTTVPPGENPAETYHRLKGLYRRWIRPEEHTKEEIGDAIILEQFLRVLPGDIRTWVMEHEPKEGLAAAKLTQQYINARKGARQPTPPPRFPRREGPTEWESPAKSASDQSIVQYVLEMRERLVKYQEEATHNLTEAQRSQKTCVPALILISCLPIGQLLLIRPHHISTICFGLRTFRFRMAISHILLSRSSELTQLLASEVPPEPLRPEKDRVVFFQRLAVFYVRYLQVFRNLEVAYDQVVHPQKRVLIRTNLDGVIGRLLELKNEMVEKEYSEYHYMDDVLHDLKLTPENLEIPIPQHFISEYSKDVKERKEMVTNILKTMAITERPQFWRGFVERKKTQIAREQEEILLGMAMDPKYYTKLPTEITALENEAQTRIKQKEYEEDYQKSIVAVKSQLKHVEGQDISQTMKDQIRQWFFECRDATGTFPDYPDDEEGGSALIFTEKNPQQLMEEIAAKEEEEANAKPKGKEEKGKKDKGKAVEDEEEEGLKMLPSAFLADLVVGNKMYDDYWRSRDESKNYIQKHVVELIKEEKRREIEAEVRLQVDEQMRQELAEWKLSVDKEKLVKAKANAKKKKGSKSGKKKKKEKDLTADRTLESLCKELAEQGLLKQPDDVKMKDFLGDYSYLGTTLRQNDIEPMPSLSDVRQVLSLYAILPLGSQFVHERAPLIKAILLAGPAGVGKKMLVHAVCQETGANLFDLSPLNTAGKYPGKSGAAMMLHMVFKVARLLQPSVIWIGDAEKMFYKKVPKEERELDPKRLKKDLPKALKLIKGEDRVLIIGTTNDPLSADIKGLCKMYSKILLIPRPDYGSRFILWKQLIQKHGGKLTKALNLSSLSKISDGFTAGHIVKVIQTVITKRRILQQAQVPLTAMEFIEPLAKIEPVFQEEEEALKGWYAKTPLGKKRIKAATGQDEEEASAKPAKGKDAKKKGK
uniref:SCAN box domain-containing protein n=1 Tax=Knipowitschia caucasica TaxID=637954 RepID=A0AAV2KMH6_KNICA